jgi:hypothetical protein
LQQVHVCKELPGDIWWGLANMLVQKALLHMASCVVMIEGRLVTYRFSHCAPRMACGLNNGIFQIRKKKKKIK